jgi:hypothetical protein
MRLLLTVIAATALFAPLAAFAEEAQPQRQTLEWLVLNDPNRVVCAYYYHEGTVVRRPFCRTARYWFMEHERTRREILEWQLRGLTSR